MAMDSGTRSGWDANTSNVEWCEAVTHLYALHPCCAELVNTVTNVCAFSSAMVGLRRARARGLPASFVFTELVLAVVAIGSTLFHATRSYYAEMLDELPMSVMAIGYIWVLKDKHWLTSPPYWARFFATYIAAVALVWASYLSFHMYSAFVACFTLQVILAALISLAAGPAHLQRLWFMFLVSIIAGKAVWEIERQLHRSGKCPGSMMQITWWFHSIWHFFSALAHGIWMYYVAETPVLDVSQPKMRAAGGALEARPDAGGSGASRRSSRLANSRAVTSAGAGRRGSTPTETLRGLARSRSPGA